MDQILLSRIQFAFTASYHFIFVPITIGIGLIMAIFVTRAYRTKTAEDDAIARMWIKIYTATFAIGVATGITMEFSFGTNWANYSRFVGDIFGAPLAAEALFAFFLESIFLGFLIFGRNKIRPALYVTSAWLTFAGSTLSALWILIANSWMQTPAGAVLGANGNEAVITDFFAAAFNASTLPRFGHTVLSLLVMGSFVTIAVAAWYIHKGGKKVSLSAASKMLVTGVVVGAVSTCCLLVSAHSSAVEVWNEQPTKMAMMEGLYEMEVPELAIAGFVDEATEETTAIGIPGGTSFLATGTWDTAYPGLNDLAQNEQFEDIIVSDMPVNFVYQTYHLMVAMFGCICIVLILAIVLGRRKQIEAGKGVAKMKWLQWLLIISPIFPFVAIQTGWLTAEVGRQPYVVYPANSSPDDIAMMTSQGISLSVQSFELVITLILFAAVYLMLLIGWVRVIGRFIAEGPVYDKPATADDASTDISFRSLSSDSAAASGDDAKPGSAPASDDDAEVEAEIDAYVEKTVEDTPDVEEGLIVPLDEADMEGGDER